MLLGMCTLAGYAKAADKKAGGWWVVNKAGSNTYQLQGFIEKEVYHIQQTANTLEEII